MGTKGEELAKIHKYILDNLRYFCDPHPEGLGWERPGGIPKFYVEHPEQWTLDLKRVEDLKRAARRREAVLGREDTTVSRGMASETKEILDTIRRMYQEGRSSAEIAEFLGVRERAITQVLLMGDGAYDNSASAPVISPVVNTFTQNWGRNWAVGGHRNGNGNGQHKDQPL